MKTVKKKQENATLYCMHTHTHTHTHARAHTHTDTHTHTRTHTHAHTLSATEETRATKALMATTQLNGHSPPRGLTFTWWGYSGLCQRHKPTELAHSFLFCSYVYFSLDDPFNCISFQKSYDNSPLRLNSALLVLSTIYLFMKVSLSPNIIFSG